MNKILSHAAAAGSGRMYRPIATIWSTVLTFPPRLAAITPRRITQNRSTVTPISRARMTTVIHQGSSPSAESVMSAEPVSALSAIGSATLPKSVIRPLRRASSPSSRSVTDAIANTVNAAIRDPGLPATRKTMNTGTSPSRSTVSPFGRLTRPGPAESANGGGRLSYQVHPLRSRDQNSSQVTDRQPPGGAHLRPAVHLGCLVLGAAGVAAVRGRLLDQHLPDLADALGRPLVHELVRQRRQLLDPPSDLCIRQFARQACRLRPVLVGVPEDPDRVQPGICQESAKLGEVLLGLARKADDEVRPDAGFRCVPADPLDQLAEPLPVAEPPHGPQHRAARVLERHVEVGRDTRGAGKHLDQALAQFCGLQVADPYSRDPRDRREPGQHVLKEPQVAKILAVGSGILADQHEFADTLAGQKGRLRDQVRWRAGDESPAERRDGAERAAAIAA